LQEILPNRRVEMASPKGFPKGVPETCRKFFPTVEWRWPPQRGSRDLQEILPNRRVEMAGAIGRGLATREDDWWEARVRASQGQR
jgi:hypothetical protein